MAKSKFFRAFVEGDTISDGRKITAAMIDQIVETFNVDTYTPRINVEHLKGFSPEPPFNGYGDVTAVRAQDDDITIAGKAEKRRALYCQVEGNAQLVKLTKLDQKPFPSVELTPSYAGTDKIGLIGLAFTDSPASIATQRLQFSRSAPGTLRAHGEAEVALEFEADPADPDQVATTVGGFFSTLTAMLKGSQPKADPVTPPAPVPTPPAPANDNGLSDFAAALPGAMAQALAAAIKPVADAQTAFEARFTSLETRLAQTPQQPQFQRQLATGGNGTILTDC